MHGQALSFQCCGVTVRSLNRLPLVLLQDEVDRPGTLHAPALSDLWPSDPGEILLRHLGPGLDISTSKRHGPIAVGEWIEAVGHILATLDLADG